MERYVILGACNPPLAHRALTAERPAGLLLPCNVIVYEAADGGSVASILDPEAAMSVSDSPVLAEVAAEARAKLIAVAEQLRAGAQVVRAVWAPTWAGLALAAAACTPGSRADAPPAMETTAGSPAANPTAEWLARGRAIYARECGSCHGANGEGQPNWAVPLPDGSLPAPPHDNSGHTWHHSDAELIRIVAEGGSWYSPVSKMPAFGDRLSGEDIRAVLAHIKTWWGPRERAYQAEMTWQWAAMTARATSSPSP